MAVVVMIFVVIVVVVMVMILVIVMIFVVMIFPIVMALVMALVVVMDVAGVRSNGSDRRSRCRIAGRICRGISDIVGAALAGKAFRTQLEGTNIGPERNRTPADRLNVAG